MTAPLLEVRAATAQRAGSDVLADVDLQVRPGEVLAVVGPNGAGKSTLLDLLSGAIKPAAGEVKANGRVATALQSPDLARRTARANVELALAWWGVPRRDRRARAMAALTALDVEHLAGRQATAMSGGERRRVHLARALALQADVTLLDEPFAGLDNTARAALLEDAAAALRAPGRAVVVVVHDRAEAWALADRLVVLLGGRVAAVGPPAELLASPPTPEVARFLGYTGELRAGAQVLLTRPAHARLDRTADLRATVTRTLAQEDSALLDVETAAGRLQVNCSYPAPRAGDTVRVRVTGGVLFPAPDTSA